MSELTNATHKARYYLRYKDSGKVINTICGACSCSKDYKDTNVNWYDTAEKAEKKRQELKRANELEVVASYGRKLTLEGEEECLTEEDI